MLRNKLRHAVATARAWVTGRDLAYALRIAFLMLGVTHASIQAGRFVPDHWRCLHDAVCLPSEKASNEKGGFWTPYFVWDAGHYNTVSKDWYAISPVSGNQNMAFWPLWPFILRIVHAITPNIMMFRAMVVLTASTIAGISVLAFHMLSQQVLPRCQARKATLLYALYPGAHFLLQSYPVGILNLLVCLFLTAALEKQFWQAAIWSALATATAPLGLTLPATFGALRGLQCLRMHRSSRVRAFAILVTQCTLAVTGMFAFMGLLYWRTGSPFAFAAAEAMWSHPRSFVSRLQSWFNIELVLTDFLAAFKHVGRLWVQRHSLNPSAGWETKLNWLCIGVALTSIYAGLRRIPVELTFQAWLLVALYVWLIATLQDAEASMRLLYAAPGIFISIAWVTRERPLLVDGMAVLSLLVLMIESFLSGAGYWVV